MPTRHKFDHDLEELRLNILDLGKMVDQRIGLAAQSLITQDLELANTVVVGDLVVNDLQAIIEEKCILLIATQQPFALDLRKVVAGFKISIYLERMGDLSVDLYSRVFEELRAIMMAEPKKVTLANYLLFACRFLERLGDYCTNIAEEIVYIVTGKRRNLNE